jgi:hypothetical protein
LRGLSLVKLLLEDADWKCTVLSKIARQFLLDLNEGKIVLDKPLARGGDIQVEVAATGGK